MFRPTSEHLKHQAANAKRSASIIRGIAATSVLPACNARTLSEAAAILEHLASNTRKLSAAQKRVEQKRDKALAIAKPEARRLVSLWPAGSFVDQVAIVRLSSEWHYFAKKIAGEAYTADEARRRLAETLDDARREIASSLAWQTADGKGDLATLEADLRARLAKAREDAHTQIAVLRLEKLTEREEVAA